MVVRARLSLGAAWVSLSAAWISLGAVWLIGGHGDAKFVCSVAK